MDDVRPLALPKRSAGLPVALAAATLVRRDGGGAFTLTTVITDVFLGAASCRYGRVSGGQLGPVDSSSPSCED